MSDIVSLCAQQEPTDAPVPFIDLVSQNREIAGEINQAVARVFSEQKFVLGDEVAEFEYEVADYCDSREAIGCASGTDALLLALMALDLKPGDEVITSPYTFFATGGSIHRAGAKPVFVDIRPDSYNIDPAAVKRPSHRIPVPSFPSISTVNVPTWNPSGGWQSGMA